MYKQVLVLGATGMLGKATSAYLKSKNIDVIGLSRHGPDIKCDIDLDPQCIINSIKSIKPELVINCAALVSLEKCELNPEKAYNINALAVKYIKEACSYINCKFIHISTDHYYNNDGNFLHKENDPVLLLNKYSETKFKGEKYALEYNDSLVIRTNVTGFRDEIDRPTYIEWLIKTLKSKSNIKLYTDFYTSTIDPLSLIENAIMASQKVNQTILNIASSNALSKKDFALLVAERLSIELDWAEDGSVKELKPKRCNSLGLDCSKAEGILSKKMPNSSEVVDKLLESMPGRFK